MVVCSMSSRFETSDFASPFWVARDTIPSTTADYATAPASGLIRACADGEAAAWLEFIRRFHRLIAVTASRAARRWGEISPAVVDDLAQETYLKLCDDGARVLCEFDASHPDAIFGFLKVLTANVANDYFKRLHAGKRGGSQASASLEEAERTAIAAGPASRMSHRMWPSRKRRPLAIRGRSTWVRLTIRSKLERTPIRRLFACRTWPCPEA